MSNIRSAQKTLGLIPSARAPGALTIEQRTTVTPQ